jgi:hypothetical protein
MLTKAIERSPDCPDVRDYPQSTRSKTTSPCTGWILTGTGIEVLNQYVFSPSHVRYVARSCRFEIIFREQRGHAGMDEAMKNPAMRRQPESGIFARATGRP